MSKNSESEAEMILDVQVKVHLSLFSFSPSALNVGEDKHGGESTLYRLKRLHDAEPDFHWTASL